MISKAELAAVRRMGEEFICLTEHGDFSDFAVVNRYSQLSAKLSLWAIPLLDEIELLHQAAPHESPRPIKMDSQRGYA